MAEKTRCEICDRNFKDSDGLTAHNKSKHPERIPKKKKPLPVRKVRNWSILIIFLGLVLWGVVALVNSSSEVTKIDESELDFDAPRNAIHWHPELTIIIDGENQVIPANIGLSGTHMPTHTHEDANMGVIHMENNRPTRKTVTLGYFFEVWGKNFNSECIFEYCTNKGELKMFVNGKENFEFQNYFMQDGDEILIEYTSS